MTVLVGTVVTAVTSLARANFLPEASESDNLRHGDREEAQEGREAQEGEDGRAV
jgi:hypothetical protein